MLRKKEKAQGLVEFALILPLLLLLLLGIIEAARILWAYITVQTAAREAARYAIAGRPYINADLGLDAQHDVCIRDLDSSVKEPEPYVASAQPWACASTDRLLAIEEMAMERGRNLALSNECTGSGGEVNFADPASCSNQPGAFSVMVRGQVTTQTVSGTTQIDLVTNHPGTQGLNIEVSTFYNVQMLDPIFDALMGGNFIQMQGRVVLQNEGLDAALGIIPPPAIETPNPGDEIDAGTPTANYQIISKNGYQVEQTGSLDVQLENHALGSYDIYLSNPSLGTYKICTIQTDVANRGNMSCSLASFGMPAGTYDFYSTAAGVTSPRLGISLTQVEIVASFNPTILVNNGYTWAAGSQTTLSLVAHPTEEQVRVQLYDPSGSLVQTITASTSPTSTNIIWSVPDVVGLGREVCDFRSGNPCTIRSFQATSGTPIAQVNVFVNQPAIILAAGDFAYAQGETVLIYLRGHTPNQVYDLYVKGGNPNPLYLGQTLLTNSAGDTTYPIYWDIPFDCDTDIGWPDGTFPIVSRPAGQATEVAQKNIEVDTPTDPYLTIDGGYTWPSGSFIIINLFNHVANTSHYLNFGSNRVATSDTGDDDTFLTNGCGNYLAEYTIPVTTTQGVYPVRSFVTAGNTLQATRDVTVNAEPYILVKEGSRVLPNMTITIQLGNHVPNTGYRVLYAGYELFQVQTDSAGVAEQTYDLNNLPVALRDASVFGQLRDLHSEATTNLGVVVAATTLALQGADLTITNVQFPANAGSQALNTSIPITLTIQNLSPVSITSYFDTDFYFNPSPIAPSPLAGYNFPGDAKHWRNSVGPAGQSGDTFIMTDTFVLQRYGMQTVYGFTDNRNLVYEGEAKGYAANPNNLGSTVFTVTCTAPPLTDTFDTDLGDWSTQRYPASNTGAGASISGGQLSLENDGRSPFQTDDSSGGHLFYYRTNPVTTTAGLDVIVKVTQVPKTANGARSGIEIRNSLGSTSAKLTLALMWYTPGTDRYILQPTYRENGGGTNWAQYNESYFASYPTSSAFTNTISAANPIWLRLQRAPGSDTFNYYVKREFNQPANWGAPAASVTMSTMNDQLYVGLMNTSNSNDNNGTAIFDDFSISPNPALCQDNPPPTQEIPPNLEICTSVLQDRSFEQGSPSWHYLTSDGVNRNTDAANTGLYSLLGDTFRSGLSPDPTFYQQFTMPNWVTNTTVFTLDLYVNVNDLTDDQPLDQFYAVVATTPATSTRITTPTLVADGVMPGMAWNKNSWTHLPLSLPISIDPATLESYANQSLYLILYNNSNSNGHCGVPDGCTTKFYFDDVNLLSCTKQPPPANITTRLTGNLTLHFADGTTGKPAYTKVWAYTPGDDTLYETLTLPSGEYNFYNLPASGAGKIYYLFTEYDVVEPGDACQIESMSASTSVKLFTNNNDGFPARADMHLYRLPIIDHCP